MMLSPTATDAAADGRKSRRSTLSVMVDPIRSITQRSKARDTTIETPIKEKGRDAEKAPKSAVQPLTRPPASKEELDSAFAKASQNDSNGIGAGMPASSSKARKVMQWFRSRSKGRGLGDESDVNPPLDSGMRSRMTPVDMYRPNLSSSSINATSTAPPSSYLPVIPGGVIPYPPRSTSAATDTSYSAPSFAVRMKRHVAPAKGVLRVHHGPVDPTTITTGSPPEVMKHVREVLEAMGVEIQIESEFKFRCIRAKRKRAPGVGLGLRDGAGSTGTGLAAFMMVGSAASNGVRVAFYLFNYLLLSLVVLC